MVGLCEFPCSRGVTSLRLARDRRVSCCRCTEEALVVVAQWCQPTLDIQAGEVAASLDILAVKVLEQLLPDHPKLAVFRHIARQQGDSSEPLPCQLPKLPTEVNGNSSNNSL